MKESYIARRWFCENSRLWFDDVLASWLWVSGRLVRGRHWFWTIYFLDFWECPLRMYTITYKTSTNSIHSDQVYLNVLFYVNNSNHFVENCTFLSYVTFPTRKQFLVFRWIRSLYDWPFDLFYGHQSHCNTWPCLASWMICRNLSVLFALTFVFYRFS